VQVVISIMDSDRPRSATWVSASGDYKEVTDRLIKMARRDLNLTPNEDAQIEALVRDWTPSDGFPLPKDEDHQRMFICDDFLLSMVSRSEERMQMISDELDEIFAKPNPRKDPGTHL